MSKIDSFHSYLQATKDMAQSVVHRYHTCDDEPDVAWEIIEDIMEGLIAVFLDMFGDEEKTKPVDDVVAWKDFKELQRELGQVSEANMTNFVSINQALDKIDMLTDRVEALEREVSDQKETIKNLDFKNGEYDAQIDNLTDEQNNLGIRLSLAEKKVRVLAQHCNIIFTE